jgi:hypothetical protein
MFEYVLIGTAIAVTMFVVAGIIAFADWAARKLDR